MFNQFWHFSWTFSNQWRGHFLNVIVCDPAFLHNYIWKIPTAFSSKRNHGFQISNSGLSINLTLVSYKDWTSGVWYTKSVHCMTRDVKIIFKILQMSNLSTTGINQNAKSLVLQTGNIAICLVMDHRWAKVELIRPLIKWYIGPYHLWPLCSYKYNTAFDSVLQSDRINGNQIGKKKLNGISDMESTMYYYRTFNNGEVNVQHEQTVM